MREPRTRPRACPAASAALFAVALLVAACAGDGPADPGDPASPATPASFARIQSEIFDANCQAAGCHNGQSRAGNLDLTAGRARQQLVGVAPDNAAARAAGLLRVAPFDPERSFLLRKLEGPGEGEGSRMPLGQPPLPAAQIGMIRAWIAAGAPAEKAPAASATPTWTFTPPADPTPTATPPQTATLPPASPTPAVERFRRLQAEILVPRCALAGCHTSDSRAGFLTLEGEEAWDNLVGVPPFQPAAQAEGFLRVAPADLARSFLLVKLEGPEPRFGSRMPLVGEPLPPRDIDRIRAWIAAGAPP